MFLSKLLPTEGLYCVALLIPQQGKKPKWRHFFHARLQEAETRLSALNGAGNTVFIAQATFDAGKVEAAKEQNKAVPAGGAYVGLRTHANAHQLKNFFLDIDVGEKWPLKTRKAAVDELKKFVRETGLPFPAVVSSGHGFYAHWILAQAVPANQWKTIAQLLKKVVATYSPAIGGDSSKTSDPSTVLRPPGMTNRKYPDAERPVVLLRDVEPIEFLDFVNLLGEAAKRKKINREMILPPKAVDINADFYAGLGPTGPPSNADHVADKCAQVREVREAKGNVSEPLWYNTLGLVIHCEDGDAVAHEWSSGHPDYSPEETSRKIAQWRGTGIGPTTCAKFGELNPTGCIGCPSNGKIKSPIVLGKPEPKELAPVEEQCPPPDGFRRSPDGLYVAVDDQWVRFYDCDLYVDRLAYDQSLGYEVMTIKHSLPHEGHLECTIRSSMVNDPKALITLLGDNHIKIVGNRDKKFMVNYMEGYQSKLQRMRRMSHYLCQMGWATARDGKEMFVLGKKILHSDGSSEEASLAHNVPAAAGGYRTAGDLSEWVKATRVLNEPGMEPFAFALLAGGFGAPLLKFTGFDGAAISMVGQSGAGKTLLLMMIQSVWGAHQDLMMTKNDTDLSMISRLGVYNTLPLTIDEVTNMEAMKVSNLLYQITQGRERTRLGRDSKELSNLNRWNTLAVTSSNESLVDKLSSTKVDASAEINRVFEYYVNKHELFVEPLTTDLYWTITENFGHAGEKYAEWLVKNVKGLRADLDKIKTRIEAKAATQGGERFWSAIASVAIYGGLIAKRLGLIDFEIAPVMKWAEETIREMRTDKQELSGDSVTILAQFLDDHAGNRLIVKGSALSKQGCQVIEAPRGALYVRYEIDTQRMYISRPTLKTWLSKRFGSYTKLKRDLIEMKALVEANKMKNLGAGTWFSSASQATWEINVSCRRLGFTAQRLIETAEELAKLPALPGSGKIGGKE
jgi:hypothetical protein